MNRAEWNRVRRRVVVLLLVAAAAVYGIIVLTAEPEEKPAEKEAEPQVVHISNEKYGTLIMTNPDGSSAELKGKFEIKLRDGKYIVYFSGEQDE